MNPLVSVPEEPESVDKLCCKISNGFGTVDSQQQPLSEQQAFNRGLQVILNTLSALNCSRILTSHLKPYQVDIFPSISFTVKLAYKVLFYNEFSVITIE